MTVEDVEYVIYLMNNDPEDAVLTAGGVGDDKNEVRWADQDKEKAESHLAFMKEISSRSVEKGWKIMHISTAEHITPT